MGGETKNIPGGYVLCLDMDSLFDNIENEVEAASDTDFDSSSEGRSRFSKLLLQGIQNEPESLIGL